MVVKPTAGLRPDAVWTLRQIRFDIARGLQHESPVGLGRILRGNLRRCGGMAGRPYPGQPWTRSDRPGLRRQIPITHTLTQNDRSSELTQRFPKAGGPTLLLPSRVRIPANEVTDNGTVLGRRPPRSGSRDGHPYKSRGIG